MTKTGKFSEMEISSLSCVKSEDPAPGPKFPSGNNEHLDAALAPTCLGLPRCYPGGWECRPRFQGPHPAVCPPPHWSPGSEWHNHPHVTPGLHSPSLT